MSAPDLNLLITLEVLLAEGNVTRAAHRLCLSPSAMSRALARLRKTTGDPLLVRAGRKLVPTPRALELKERVGHLVQEAEALLRPTQVPDIKEVIRSFTIRSSEGFVENFGAGLIARIAQEAPGVRLHFVQKPDKESTSLREGTIDLETGVVDKSTGPEIRSQALFLDRYVGVVRRDHPLCRGKVTIVRYVAGRHVGISRKSLERDAIDEALAEIHLERKKAIVVGGFSTGVALTRETDLIATVPERHTGTLRVGLHTFSLPFNTPEFTVSLLWHPRFQADPVHQWIRGVLLEICQMV